MSRNATARQDGKVMATTVTTIEYIEDQLTKLNGMRTRKMFGEYAVYCRNKVVALVCDDTLYVKITSAGQAFVGHDFPLGYPYPGAKAAFRIDEDKLEDREWLTELIQITYAELPEPKPKKKH